MVPSHSYQKKKKKTFNCTREVFLLNYWVAAIKICRTTSTLIRLTEDRVVFLPLGLQAKTWPEKNQTRAARALLDNRGYDSDLFLK